MESRLIQRCNLSAVADGIKMTYQYMGMSEFECGDQAVSLKRIFGRGVGLHETEVYCGMASKNIKLFVVAGKHFPISKYQPFLEALANQTYRTSELTFLDDMLSRSLGLGKTCYSDDTVDAWFDFKNDALFTISKENADLVIQALQRIEIVWNTPDPPEMVAFKKQLEKVKKKLQKAGLRWFALGSVKLIEGRYHAWLNPYEQHLHNYGWYEISDLEKWAKGRGPIMIKK